MALDGAFLRHIKKEIEEKALNSRVDKIYQPNKDEIVLSLRSKTDVLKLLLSARANSPRIHFTNHKIENPKSPPMLCMLFRKKLSSAKLVAVRQIGLERALFLDFVATDELGDKVKFTIAIEIMGKYSNIILFDDNLRIIDSLKRVDASTSSKRIVLPGVKYELPPKQDKLCLIENKSVDIIKTMEEKKGDSLLEKALLSTIQGVSPIVCREAAYLLSKKEILTVSSLDENLDTKLGAILDDLIKTVQDIKGKPIMLLNSAKGPLEFSFIDINQYEELASKKAYENFSELLDDFYFEKDLKERMKAKYSDLSKVLSNLHERVVKKIAIQKNEILLSKQKEESKLYGDIINANLYRLEKGQSLVELENFYDNNEPIKVKLDSRLTPAQNAQKYYKEYRKSKTAQKMLLEQIQKSQDEKEYIESVLDLLGRVKLLEEIEEIRKELCDQGYLKLRKSKKQSSKKLKPIEFCSSEGFKILVGRNNSQNDSLTLKESRKNDIWFHVKDMPGSHTVLVCDGNEADEKSLYEAAMIAAFYSKAGNSSGVAVDYTYIRNVSKPQGAKPGNVIYKNQKTLFVTPDKNYIKKLERC